MSAVWTITKGATALSLLADPYYLADELPLGTVPRAFDVLTGPTVDLPQIANYRTSDVRVLPWKCEVYGDDGQDLEDNLNALFDVLPGAGETATITIGRTDGTATAELELLAVSDLDAPYIYRRDMGRAAIVSCRLVCAPYTTSATDTLYSASAISLPCVLDLSAMTGQHEAPLELVLNAATADLHHVVAGVYPDEDAVIADFVKQAVVLTWSAGAAAADANGYPDGVGNTVWKTNSASAVYADIDVTSYEPGTYAVYANASRDSGADPAQVYTAYTDEVDIEGTDLRRHLLGYVSLPCSTVRGSATSSLRVYLISDGTDYVYLNTIELIPASWGITGWHHATTTESADELRFADGIVYADDVASLAYATGDRELFALGGVLILTGEAEAEAPLLAVTASLEYTPRWEQMPS